MKLLKKVYLHVIAFIILGIVYFIPLEIFWGSWGGYIFYFVIFGLTELIYYYVNKRRKKSNKMKSKFLLIISIIISLLIIFSTIFCVFDYIIAKNMKTTLFSRQRVSWVLSDNETSASVYFGLGYKIAVCSICEKNESVYIMPFGIGDYPIEYMTCSSTQENYEDEYTFVGKKFNTLYQTKTLSAKDVELIKEDYENEVKDINNTKGCYGALEKTGETYKLWKNCTLSEMSDDDFQKIYGTTKDKMIFSRKELTKLLEKDDSTINCKLKGNLK